MNMCLGKVFRLRVKTSCDGNVRFVEWKQRKLYSRALCGRIIRRKIPGFSTKFVTTYNAIYSTIKIYS
jgi:hypothetical protein